MYSFLIPLLLGFIFDAASTFTTYYSRRFGEKTATVISSILRNVLGIPLWVIGYVMAVRTPSAILFDPTLLTTTLAIVAILTGGAIILGSLKTIRWRAMAPSMQDSLVSQGLYSYIRHPVYSGMILELIGLSLWIPTLPVMIACVLGILWVMIQARLEELDLVQRLPGYREYMQRVPRFLPKFRHR